jgi:hypothetical protein
MFELGCTGWSFDHGLQIIHADVRMAIDGKEIIDEPLCVDVGLPAMLLSAVSPTESNRWSQPEQWEKKPFFCCGCGDPECRAFSFRVRHDVSGSVLLTELEERENGEPRELDEHTVEADGYREAVLAVGRQFLAFVEKLDDRPMYPETMKVMRGLVEQLDRQP